MNLASIASPTEITEVMSSTRSLVASLARINASTPPSSSTETPLASTAVTLPETIAPFLVLSTKLVNGSDSNCLIPKEIRSFNASTCNTTASTSSPFL